MNRCLPDLKSLVTLAALCLGCFAPPALAQMRQFPANAEVGRLEVTTPPVVLLNNQPARLSPGSRIRSANNLVVLPASLVGQQHWVRLVKDPQGLLHEVWILSEAETQAQRSQLPVFGNWTSGNQTQTPKDDGKTPFNQLPKFPNN